MASRRKKALRPSKQEGIQWVERADGWRCRARITVGTSGAREQVTGRWRADLKEALADRDELLERGKTPPARLVTLSEAMRGVLAKCEATGARPATVKSYRERFNLIADAFPSDPPLHQIDAGVLEAWARERHERGALDGDREPTGKPLAWATIHSDLRAWNRLFTVAGLPSPVREARSNLPAAAQPEVDWFTPEELGGVLKRMRSHSASPEAERDASIFEFLALTGLRLKEATQLRVSDVSLAKGTVRIRAEVGKRGARTIKLGPDGLLLASYLLAGREKFPARSRDTLMPVGYHALQTALRRWADRLKEPRMHAHAARHTFGTTLARNGASVPQIKAAMGHRTTHMAERYIHLTGADVEDAVAAVSYRTA